MTTLASFDSFSWDVLKHPAYNPELTPSDFYLLISSKIHIAENDKEYNN